MLETVDRQRQGAAPQQREALGYWGVARLENRVSAAVDRLVLPTITTVVEMYIYGDSLHAIYRDSLHACAVL